VGPAAATEFLAFRSWSRELPAVRRLLTGELPIQIPERADQRYALACSAAYHTSREPELLPGFLALTSAMSSDFALMSMLDYLGARGERAIPGRVKELTRQPGFLEWRRRHGQALEARLPSLGKERSQDSP
jgi:hypothetical protein